MKIKARFGNAVTLHTAAMPVGLMQTGHLIAFLFCFLSPSLSPFFQIIWEFNTFAHIMMKYAQQTKALHRNQSLCLMKIIDCVQ